MFVKNVVDSLKFVIASVSRTGESASDRVEGAGRPLSRLSERLVSGWSPGRGGNGTQASRSRQAA